MMFGLIVSFLLAVFLVFKLSFRSVEIVQAERNISFTSEALQFEDTHIQLLNSSHSDTEHTFHFNIENIKSTEISTRSTSFSIENSGKTFTSEQVKFDDLYLNPGMRTAAIVKFKMNKSALTEGAPTMLVKRRFFGASQEVELNTAN